MHFLHSAGRSRPPSLLPLPLALWLLYERSASAATFPSSAIETPAMM